MKKLLLVLLCLISTAGFGQPMMGPYDTGAIRASGRGPEAQFLKFDADAEPPAYAEGRLFWDKDNGCLGVYPDVNGPILQVGQEFWARVKNPGVATITNGTVVYLDPPTTGKDPVAKLAQANASDTACMLGVVTHDISPDSTGFVTIQGLVRDLHNSEFTAGQRVYLSATAPGSYTASVPAAPNFPVKVGHVVKAHDGAGVLYVKQQLNGAFERAQFASTISTATGTAAAPAYSFSSDPDTGIYSPGANTIGFGEGGAESMRITSGGNVLIATSTDDGSSRLQVNGFTKLGEAATGIKMKVLTSPLADAENTYVLLDPGVSGSKILDFNANARVSSGATFPAGFTLYPGYEFYCYIDSDGKIVLYNDTTNSELVLSASATVTLWYKE